MSSTLSLKRSHDNSGLSADIEDVAGSQKRPHSTPIVTKHTTLTSSQPLGGSWRNVLGPPPSRGTTKVLITFSLILSLFIKSVSLCS